MNIGTSTFTRRSIRRFVTYLFICVYGAMTLFVPLASAHTLETDGTISGVLHFEPDDKLVSGEPAQYILFLSDSAKRFSLADCNCTVTLKEKGKTISGGPLQENTQHNISGMFNFPDAGVYDMTFHGTPIKEGAFQPFTLQYTEEVAANPNAKGSPLTFVLSIGGAVVALLTVAIWVKLRYIRLRQT